MRFVLACLLVLHGLVHLMGFVKGFGLAPLPQLAQPISRPAGMLWLGAAALLLAAAMLLFVAPRAFWLVGALGIVLSQALIVASWGDARFGTIANVVLLLAVIYGAAAWGPFGLHAEYAQRAARLHATSARPALVAEADLAPLPEPVQRYLRFAGVVGQPRVQGFRVRFTGRLRNGPDGAWMDFHGEQHSALEPPTRLFWMQARMYGLPVEALHIYDAAGARMRVKLLSLLPMVDASGAAFRRTETVTFFNDLCIMAPAALLDPAIRWRPIDARQVEASYANGPHEIRATLVFDDTGALVDFRSDDRPALARDGLSFLPQRWSTPVGEYRRQGAVRLASRGEARYAAPGGEYAYIEFRDLEVSYDLNGR